MSKRIAKAYQDITLTEVTQSDGKKIVSRAYSVRAGNDPTAAKQFSDMGAAESYFEELIIGRLNPRR
jgi:hypothetical protein